MNAVLLLIIMIIMGAVIGGFTNSLAIKMLFRPYQAVYIKNWRVPFTPGLIPKRRKDMAEQMGRMVVDHLLTPEGMQEKFNESGFQKQIVNIIQREAKEWLHSERSVAELLEQYAGVTDARGKMAVYSEEWLDKKIQMFIYHNQEKTMDEMLPPEWKISAESYFDSFAARIADKGARYFESDAGRVQLETLLEKFLQGKGSVFNFLSSMFGNDKILDKLQPELVRFFRDPSSAVFFRGFIIKEWEKLLDQPVWKAGAQLNTKSVARYTIKALNRELTVLDRLEAPIAEWGPSYEEQIINQWIPELWNQIQPVLSNKLISVFDYLELEDVIRERVDTFSVGRLEAMVLSISGKEFKMITYLGALLGGFIGAFQGLFVLFFS